MSQGHDTAGVPWSGRQLGGTGFDGDTGAADPALLAALDDPSDERALVAAVARARLLVPVVATAGKVETGGGLPAEKSTDMAAVTLTAPDGQRALPLFTSIAALAGWDPDARPVPVTADRAAQAAVQERCGVLLLDLGAPRQRVLRSSMLWALAMQREWLPAHEDPFVAQALAAAVADEPDVASWSGQAGEPAGVLRVVLGLRPGLDAERVQALATRVGERVAADGEARARIDGLAFTIRPS